MNASAPVNRSSEEMEMRALIVPELRKRWPGARVIHELPLRYSTNRIDLAAVTPTEIIGCEIKSSRDVVDRLEAQLRSFAPICSRLIVALAPVWNERRPPKARKVRTGTIYDPDLTEAQQVVARVDQAHIETWTVDAAARVIEVTDPRYSKNDCPWLAQMLHMLHVAELARIAARHGIVQGKRDTHDFLMRRCAELMNGREIKAAVCAALRARDAFVAGSDAPVQAERAAQ